MGRLIKVKEARIILGVCSATLYRWEKLNKINITKRNPINNYRMYDIDDIEKLKGKIK